MGYKSEFDQDRKTPDPNNVTATATRSTAITDDIPPIYYDSEPSSQPPKYSAKNLSTQQTSRSSLSPLPTCSTATSKPPNQHRHSAPAQTVAAILANPYEDLDVQRRAERKKKTLRQRWRDFKDRNFHDDADRGTEVGAAGSAPEWNVMGGRLQGGQPSPYRKKNGK